MTVKWLIVPLVFMLLKYGQTEGTNPCVNVNITQETALNGSDVILHCVPKLPINADHDILEWKKGESEIYIIREGKPEGPYKDRASVPIEEFKKGNASLKLFHVMESDKGEHCCCINRYNERECTAVNLIIIEEDKEKKEESKDKKDAQTLTTEMPLDSTIPPTAGPGDTMNNKGLIIGLIIGLIVSVVLNLVLAAVVGRYCYKQRHQILNAAEYELAPDQQPAL